MKQLSLIVIYFCLQNVSKAQPNISVASDVAYLRSFKKDQRFGAIGQTVHLHYHVTAKEGLYAWISFYQKGKFENTLTATAKSPLTSPQQYTFQNNASVGFKQYSLGWKHYFIGGSEGDSINWSIYGFAGFGLMAGRATNSYNTVIDTSAYISPANPVNGSGKFKRLTLDLGAGWEKPLSDRIFFYAEARIWIPASSYPTQYLFVNKNAPVVATLNAGLRVLFE